MKYRKCQIHENLKHVKINNYTYVKLVPVSLLLVSAMLNTGTDDFAVLQDKLPKSFFKIATKAASDL